MDRGIRKKEMRERLHAIIDGERLPYPRLYSSMKIGDNDDVGILRSIVQDDLYENRRRGIDDRWTKGLLEWLRDK